MVFILFYGTAIDIAPEETELIRVMVYYRSNCQEDIINLSELRKQVTSSALFQSGQAVFIERDILQSDAAAELNDVLDRFNVAPITPSLIIPPSPSANLPMVVITRGEKMVLLDKGSFMLTVSTVDKLVKGENAPQPALISALPTLPSGISAQSASGMLLLTSLLTGFYSGINPCAISLFTFLLAVSIKQSVKRSLYKVATVSLGLLLSYMLFGIIFLLFQVPLSLITPMKVIATTMLVAFGVIHLGGYFQSELFLWKTPRKIYNYIVKLANVDSLQTDFYLGALFGLIKIPCIGPMYTYWIFRLFTVPNLAPLIIMTFNLGLISIPLILSIFTTAGLVRFEEFKKIRTESRQPYKIVTGVLLVALAFFIWLF